MYVDMWGHWSEDEDQTAVNGPSFFSFFKTQRTPQENILRELDSVRSVVVKELIYLENPETSVADKRKRLTYLFMKDMLDGVNGMILDHKDRLDNEIRQYTSLTAKIISSVFILLVCLAMLLYLYLFAMRQTIDNQSAWLKSFLMWLFFEIFLVCTGLVLIEHVLIPLWSMRSVQTVKKKIAQV